ncbi:hypothetical protein ACFL2C_02780 [Patescibacteria group bacterium]
MELRPKYDPQTTRLANGMERLDRFGRGDRVTILVTNTRRRDLKPAHLRQPIDGEVQEINIPTKQPGNPVVLVRTNFVAPNDIMSFGGATAARKR